VRGFGGGGVPPRPPGSERRSGETRVHRERAVICEDVVDGGLERGSKGARELERMSRVLNGAVRV
jgi:hypothetical protein